MENENATRSNRNFITEGLILGAITSLVYWVTYIYESSYLNYFGIPDYFINLSLISIMKVIIILGLLLYCLFSVIPPLTTRLGLYKLWQKLIFVVLIVMLLGLICINDNDPYKKYVISFFIITILIFIALSRNCNKSNQIIYSDDLNSFINIIQSKSLIDKLISLFIVISLSICGLWYLTTSVGKSNALRQKSFLITSTNPEMLVIMKYDTNLICIPFNRESKLANKRFLIIDTKTKPEIIYRLEYVGPITMID